MPEGPIIIRDGDAGGIPLSGEAAANQRRQLRSLRRQNGDLAADLAVTREAARRLQGDVDRLSAANQRLDQEIRDERQVSRGLRELLDERDEAIELLEAELEARKGSHTPEQAEEV